MTGPGQSRWNPDGNGTREAAVPLAIDDWQIGPHLAASGGSRARLRSATGPTHSLHLPQSRLGEHRVSCHRLSRRASGIRGANGTKSGITADTWLWPIKRSTGSALIRYGVMDDWGTAPKRLKGNTTEERMDLILIIIILVLLFGGGFGYHRWGYGGGIGIGGILLIVLIVYLLLGRGGL